jgi:hypothetical protein
MAIEDFAAIVAQAEKAVAAVKDPELRRIAFQKVLDSLLDNNSSAGDEDDKPAAKKVPRKSVKVKGGAKSAKVAKGVAGYISELVDEGFFKKQKTIAEVKAELENRGHHIPLTSLSGPLQRKCQQHALRRQKIKSGNKQTFAYSNW